MDKREIRQLPYFKPNKTPAKRTVKEIVYHIVGIILSLLFLFPILYMLATSTKSEVTYAESLGSLKMFLPDFANLGVCLVAVAKCEFPQPPLPPLATTIL